MSVKENKAIINDWVEQVWNQKNVAAVDEFLAIDYLEHNLANPDEIGSLQGVKQMALCATISETTDRSKIKYNEGQEEANVSPR
ncbi:MAG: hypothetical protein JW934_19050, partial [Anaerolineae bacterium]|nr:hypothetical protein [Anaerolineae bacterium]